MINEQDRQNGSGEQLQPGRPGAGHQVWVATQQMHVVCLEESPIWWIVV